LTANLQTFDSREEIIDRCRSKVNNKGEPHIDFCSQAQTCDLALEVLGNYSQPQQFKLPCSQLASRISGWIYNMQWGHKARSLRSQKQGKTWPSTGGLIMQPQWARFYVKWVKA